VMGCFEGVVMRGGIRKGLLTPKAWDCIQKTGVQEDLL